MLAYLLLYVIECYPNKLVIIIINKYFGLAIACFVKKKTILNGFSRCLTVMGKGFTVTGV